MEGLTLSIESIQAAKARADGIVLANQALQLWASTQRDLLWTIAEARRLLVAEAAADQIAQLVIDQGVALYVSFSRAASKMAAIQSAMETLGFDGAAVAECYALVLDACDRLRSTAADGSGLIELCEYCEENFTAPETLF